MKRFFLFATLALLGELLPLTAAFSQIATGGPPRSFASKRAATDLIDHRKMPSQDFSSLLDRVGQDAHGGKVPFRFGVDIDVDLGLSNSGSWQELPGGDRIWRLKISSPDSYSINLIYSDFFMPEGASLHVYDPRRSHVLGGFTGENNRSSRTFATGLVRGDTSILEYYEPAKQYGKGAVRVSKVIHGYRNLFGGDVFEKEFGDSGDCNNNVNCPEGSPWADQIRSVALILLSNNTSICTGALINNTGEETVPYFLTADHCLFSVEITQNWIFMFNYESLGCTSSNGRTQDTILGCTVKARNSHSDFMLLELSSTPPSDYNAYYSGWSRATSPPQNSIGIHHPNGDVKKISFDDDAPVVSNIDSESDSGHDDTHWKVFWDDGTTEGGSSGSPLFDGDGRIYGQLHGGGASCTAPEAPDFYGRLAVSWGWGDSSDSRLSDWLDPGGTDAVTLDGWSGHQGPPAVPHTPNPPQPVHGSSSSLEILWARPFDNGAVISGYELQQREGTSGEFSTVYSGGTNLSYVSEGLTIGATYYYRVRAVNLVGYSGFSQISSEVVKDLVIMTDGVTVIGCGRPFLDPGGYGPYSNYLDVTMTLAPASSSDKVGVTFHSFSLETNYDRLYVYDGAERSSNYLRATLTGSSLPGPITSSSSDGNLTFRFTSDESIVSDGWEAEVSCLNSPVPDAASVDVAALTALYEATDGPNWDNDTGWPPTTGVYDLFGVTVEEGRVAELDLHGNNLSGSIPPELGQLSRLTDLRLYGNSLGGSIPSELGQLALLEVLQVWDNRLSGIPDLTDLPLSAFQIDYNYFEFDDLELNKDIITSNEGQNRLGEGALIDGVPEGTITLSFDIGGSANVYEWLKDGSSVSGETAGISGEDTSILTISNYNSTDHAGVYALKITSTNVAEVTLWSKPKVVGPSTSVPMFGGEFGGAAEIEGCDRIFQDGGGPGSYENWRDITMTLLPQNSRQQVRVTFTSFTTESGYDFLRAYHGNIVGEASFAGEYSGSSLPPVLTSTSSNGALTFHFDSDHSIVHAGWEATVECLGVPDMESSLDHCGTLDFATSSAAGNDVPVDLWSDDTTLWVLDGDDRIYAYDLSTMVRDELEDFTGLIEAGNVDSNGLWSDGNTMWVTDWQDDKIYAYNLSTKARDELKDFDTLSEAGNDWPRGLWSNRTTMWVADFEDTKLYAYNLSTKARDELKDLNTLSEAGNDNPNGLWSDGTTMWVADLDDDKIYAYDLSDKARDESKDIDTLEAAGNTSPLGLWSDGTTMWVADLDDDKIYAYTSECPPEEADVDGPDAALTARTSSSLTISWTQVSGYFYVVSQNGGSDYTEVGSVGTYTFTGLGTDTEYRLRVRGTNSNGSAESIVVVGRTAPVAATLSSTRCAVLDFTTLSAAGNNGPQGLWSDGVTMWVSDWEDVKIYAYNLSTKVHDESKDFTTLNAAENNGPQGLWSDGVTMWVSDFQDDKVYAYNLSTKVHDESKDFTTLSSAGNGRAAGLWSDWITMWVVDWDDDKIYAYNLSTKVRDELKDFDTLSAAGNNSPGYLWSDGVTMWVSDWEDVKIYAYNLSTKVRDEPKDFTTLGADGNDNLVGLWSDGSTMWVVDNDKIDAHTSACPPDVPGVALTARTSDSLTISWTQVSGHSYEVSRNEGADYTEAESGDTYVFTGLSPDTEYRIRVRATNSGGSVESLIVVDRTAPATEASLSSSRCGNLEFTTLIAAGNTGPRGLWSDGVTLWVADHNDAKLYAYDLSTKAHDALKDFDALSAAGNNSPVGLWSDGVTMWVSDWEDARLYAYDLSGKVRDELKDFDTLSAAGNTDPRGLWSDGTTMWVADYDDGKVYAYNLSTRVRDEPKDFNTLSAAENTAPYGLWSDGTTMWVSDLDDDRLYAYNLFGKVRDELKDLNPLIAAGNVNLRGFWSDGTTLWATDLDDYKIYAYSSACPAVVPDVVVTGRTSTSLTISWTQAPSHTYAVSRSGGTIYTEAESVDMYTFTGLSPDTQYRLRVRATNSGSTSESVIVVGRTSAATQATLSSSRCATLDFTTLSAAGNAYTTGLWSDGATLWVSDYEDSKLYAYNLLTGAHNDSKDFDTLRAAGNHRPRGLWSDGTTMWVADRVDTKIYAYDLSTRARDKPKDFDTLSAAGNTGPEGLWSNGTTMWVADKDDAKIYAYNLLTQARDDSKDLDTLSAAGNNLPRGLWSDGTTMWVADLEDYKIYAYTLSNTRDESKDLDTSSADGNDGPIGLWSDGITLWVADYEDAKIYAYSSDCRPSAPDIVVTGRTSDSFSISWTQALSHTYKVSRSGGTTYTEAGSVDTYTFIDLSPDTEYHLRVLATNSTGSSESSIVVDRTAPATEASLSSNRCADFDLDVLSAAGNTEPSGLWSNRTTLWVADREDAKIYAYDLSGTRDDLKDLDTLSSAGNNYPEGLWSDGITMWVADAEDARIYAYNLLTKAHDELKDFATLSAAGNNGPQGLWSDRTTLWVADWDDKVIYAYNLSTKARDDSKDFIALRAAGNTTPWGLWSDGITMWVADTEGAKIYAYNRSTRARDDVKDLITFRAAGSASPYGLWSDGTTMRVVDNYDAKIYAYSSACPPDAADVVLTGRTPYSLTVSWTQASGHSYAVSRSGGAVYTEAGSVDTYTFIDLSPDTEYRLRVLATNSVGSVEGAIVADRTAPVTQATLSSNRCTTLDFTTSRVNEYTYGVGLWSDGNTLWVADYETIKIHAYNLRTRTRDDLKDFNTLRAAGNTRPRGLWSDGITMWVADSQDDKLYAYNLLTKAHDELKDFDTLRAAGNNGPEGLWSDRTTLWVSDREDDIIYAYSLSTKARDDSKDFNTLRAAGNTIPRGLWSDGTTMWVADVQDDKLYAYNLFTKVRDDLKDFTTLAAAGNGDSAGLWSDGITMWVADAKIYAYSSACPPYQSDVVVTGRTSDSLTISWTRVSGQTHAISHNGGTTYTEAGSVNTYTFIDLSSDTEYRLRVRATNTGGSVESMIVADRTAPVTQATLSSNRCTTLDFTISRVNEYTYGVGLWSDGNTLWVADDENIKIYAYNLLTKARDDLKDFNTLRAAGNTRPRGLWSDGITMWVADSQDDKLYAYNLLTKARDELKDFDTLRAAGNNGPEGLWSDRTTLWVSDREDDIIYAYNLSTKARNGSKDFNTLRAAGNTIPRGLWSDGTTMWVADVQDDKLYAYNLFTKVRDDLKDFTTLAAAGNGDSAGLWSDGITMWVADAKIYAYSSACPPYQSDVVVTGRTFDSLTISWTRVSGQTHAISHNGGTTYTEAGSVNTYTFIDLSPDTEYRLRVRATNTGGSVESMIVVDRTTPALEATLSSSRCAPLDFTTLSAGGNTSLVDLWSDGATLWVADGEDITLYAYNLSSKARDPSEDFTMLNAAGNNMPRGLWSDGITMWVADSGGDKIHAYNLSTRAHDDSEVFDTLRAAGNTDPGGIWSNGTTLWVADRDDDKLYAYDLSTKARDELKDVNALDTAGNTDPGGIWSDGTTLWVTDTEDAKFYAYNLSTKARVESKDFATLGGAGNAAPVSLWSDGTTTWVADGLDSRIYAYSSACLPDSPDVVVTGRTFDGLTISWTQVSGQTYAVSRTGGTPYTEAGSVDTYTFTGLSPDTEHRIRVLATNSQGDTESPIVAERTAPATQAAFSSSRCDNLDVNSLASAGNNGATGLWSDGTTLWVADNVSDKIYAYTLSGKVRDEPNDFTTLSAAGNINPSGLWSDGITMWVADAGSDKIYAYNLLTKARDESNDFNALTAAGNNIPRGLWSDGTTMWVADYDDGKIYAYNLSTKARDESKDFTTPSAAGNTHPIGLWSDGTTMWVTNYDDGKIYAYNLFGKARDVSKDLTTLIGAGNTGPVSLWSDGTTLWVTDLDDDKIYAYSSACPPDVVVTGRTSDSLTISWTQVSGLSYAVSLDGGVHYADVGATSTYTFTGLSPDTSYSLKVKATEAAGIVESTTIVERTLSSPHPSVMIRGSSHVTLTEGSEAMTFMATGSAGATYAWVCTGGPPTPILGGEDTASLSFLPSDVTEDTDYLCEVTATGDGTNFLGTSTASIRVTVTPLPIPSVTVGDEVTVLEGETTSLTARGVGIVFYSWSCTSTTPGAPPVSLVAEASPIFIAPQVEADTVYICEVTATGDGAIAEGEASASVVVTVTDGLADTSSPVFVGSIPGSPFVFTVGTPMSVNLPTASDENLVTYAFTSTVFLPAGLMFTNADPPTLSGTTMAAADDYGPYTYAAADDQGNPATTSPAFMITVTRARAEISFGFVKTITSMGATVPVASDTAAVIHYGVVEVDGAPPDTLDEVRALTAYATLTIDTGQVATMHPAVLTGLMADTSYKLYAVLVGEGGGVLSDYASSPAFTTLSSPFTLGADESRLGVIAYPNPVGDTLYLELPPGDDYRVSVLTLTGQTVIEGRYGGGSRSLDFSLLGPGVYLLQVEADEGGTQMLRVVTKMSRT